MIELENITFKEYYSLEDKTEYDYCAKYAYKFTKPMDHYGIGDLMKQLFGVIKDLEYDLQDGLTWEQVIDYLVLMSHKVTLKSLGSETFLRICQAKSFLLGEIEQLIEVEKIALAYAPTGDEVDAGIEELAPLGIYMQLRQVAITFHKSIQEIREWEYELCFTELVTQKRLSDYDRRLKKV